MLPLPEGWGAPSVVEDRIVADGVLLHRAGLSSIAPSGEEITGSAAGPSSDVLARGEFELLERAATLEAIRARRPLTVRDRAGAAIDAIAADDLFPASDEPVRWRYARSNGVALHASWEDACDRALWELVERDRVLRSWYGAIAPRRVGFDVAASPLAGAASIAFEAYVFDDPDGPAWSAGIAAAAVIGFPCREEVPLVVGYGARPDLAAAVAAAAGEAAQLLAFLWGEALPSSEPEPGPTPMHHLEHLLWVETAPRLRRWLEGAHRTFARPGGDRPAEAAAAPRFADLTPAWPTRLRVARAIAPGLTPLTFGDAPLAAHLPDELRLHPIA
jgi:hypothetical protein